jgi:KEOPS complex subunit Cgi121
MTKILVTGGRSNIMDVKAFLKALGAIAAANNSTIQAVNADMVAGREHIEFAARKAIKSFKEKNNLARDMGMETMLYLRGRRQIEKALEFGIKPGENNIAIVLIGDEVEKALPEVNKLLDSVDGSVIDYRHEKDPVLMRLYEITPEEALIAGKERIPQLVRERSALLEFEK